MDTGVRTSTFTSYINVEPDQAIDQKFAALERQAQQTFNKIAASAAKANSAMAGRGGTAGMIGGANPAVMQSQARALRDVERENQRIAVAVARTSQKISDQSLVTARARREMSGIERCLRTTAPPLNEIGRTSCRASVWQYV